MLMCAVADCERKAYSSHATCKHHTACSTEFCSNKVFSNSLCATHYKRQRSSTGRMSLSEVRNRASSTHKHCVECRKFAPLEDFPKYQRGFLNRASECKTCMNARHKEWRGTRVDEDVAAAKASARAHRVLRTYGSAGLALHEEIVAGTAKCAVCGKAEQASGRSLHIDHNHETGEVRGLLCHGCNTALGLLDEDVDLMMSLAAYVLQFNSVLGKVSQ